MGGGGGPPTLKSLGWGALWGLGMLGGRQEQEPGGIWRNRPTWDPGSGLQPLSQVRRNKSLSTGWTAQQRPGSARDDGNLGTAEGPEAQDGLLGARFGGTPLSQPSSVLGPQTSTCPRLRLPSLIPLTPNLGPPFQAQSHQVVRQKLPEKAIQEEAAAEAGE